MDAVLRGRLQALLEKKESPAKRRGSKLRQRVEKILRHEQDNKDQRTGAGQGGRPMGKVSRGLETADLNPTAERD